MAREGGVAKRRKGKCERESDQKGDPEHRVREPRPESSSGEQDEQEGGGDASTATQVPYGGPAEEAEESEEGRIVVLDLRIAELTFEKSVCSKFGSPSPSSL